MHTGRLQAGVNVRLARHIYQTISSNFDKAFTENIAYKDITDISFNYNYIKIFSCMLIWKYKIYRFLAERETLFD